MTTNYMAGYDYAGETPLAPYWLPQFAPGQTAWEPMQKLPVKVPSGQLWYKTPYSQRAGLESYINWAAGTPGVIASYEDLLDLLERMRLRRSPSRAAQWYPATQW